MLNQWPSVCCEDRERFSAALFAKSHSLRCDSSAGQTHTHTHTLSKQLGMNCRNYYWPFFHRIWKYFNKQSLYLGALSFTWYFCNKKLTHTSGLGSWQHPHCTFPVPLLWTPWILSLEFYIHPKEQRIYLHNGKAAHTWPAAFAFQGELASQWKVRMRAVRLLSAGSSSSRQSPSSWTP